MIVCAAEDRRSHQPAVKLLLLSLAAQSPTVPVMLFYPVADAHFRSWLSRVPNVMLETEPLAGKHSYNVKPHAILATMQRGYEDVVWIDSDIILARDFRRSVESDPQTIVAAESAIWEPRDDPNGMRARAWGFEVGRVLPFCANSCVLRVNRAHTRLLERWRMLLESDVYKNGRTPADAWRGTPIHKLGDQDVLTALLASRDFADIPLRFVMRRKDIIQYFGPYGYTTAERFRHLVCGMPTFVHSQGPKPWASPKEEPSGNDLRSFVERLYKQLSPYKLIAAKYKNRLDEDPSWMEPGSPASAGLRLAGFSHPALVGFPIALLSDSWRLSKALKALATS